MIITASEQSTDHQHCIFDKTCFNIFTKLSKKKLFCECFKVDAGRFNMYMGQRRDIPRNKPPKNKNKQDTLYMYWGEGEINTFKAVLNFYFIDA